MVYILTAVIAITIPSVILGATIILVLIGTLSLFIKKHMTTKSQEIITEPEYAEVKDIVKPEASTLKNNDTTMKMCANSCYAPSVFIGDYEEISAVKFEMKENDAYTV